MVEAVVVVSLFVELLSRVMVILPSPASLGGGVAVEEDALKPPASVSSGTGVVGLELGTVVGADDVKVVSSAMVKIQSCMKMVMSRFYLVAW